MNVGIVGLGLMGGSIAKALKKKTNYQVLGLDISPTVLKQGLESGAVDKELTLEQLASCDIVLITLYPNDTKEFLKENRLMFSPSSLIIDFCGVKKVICDFAKEIFNEVNSPIFIGGHPMAGKEVSGFEHADLDLFSGASMILTPDQNINPELLKFTQDFFLTLGFGNITITTPEEHDRIIAYTSQMAHVVSNAYIQSPTASGFMGFSAGSFKDLTRVAYLNEAMWSELFIHNGQALVGELDVFIKNMTEFRNLIAESDQLTLSEKLKKGRLIKEIVNQAQEKRG